MKKLVFAFAMMAILSIASFARDPHSTTIQGFVTDTACAAHGKKTCSDRTHVRRDNPMVLVSDSDATIFTLGHPGRLVHHLGQHVEVTGIVDRAQKTIDIESFTVLN